MGMEPTERPGLQKIQTDSRRKQKQRTSGQNIPRRQQVAVSQNRQTRRPNRGTTRDESGVQKRNPFQKTPSRAFRRPAPPPQRRTIRSRRRGRHRICKAPGEANELRARRAPLVVANHAKRHQAMERQLRPLQRNVPLASHRRNHAIDRYQRASPATQIGACATPATPQRSWTQQWHADENYAHGATTRRQVSARTTHRSERTTAASNAKRHIGQATTETDTAQSCETEKTSTTRSDTPHLGTPEA